MINTWEGTQVAKPKTSSVLNGKYDFDKPISELETKIQELEDYQLTTELDLSGQMRKLQQECDELKRRTYDELTPWQRVLVARHPNRPLALDYIELVMKDFLELHGDRVFADDPAVITGFGTIANGSKSFKVMLIAHQKGRTLNEKMACNFGCAHPEGYRKAMLRMRLAEKVGLPIVTLIDTPGAFPGIASEERGVAFAIAQNLREMSSLRVPVVSVVIGEGGSGGALGIGVADRLLMLENSYYSVISPEGCAAILWRGEEKERLADAASILKLTSKDLHELGIVDEIIPEPLGGAHRNYDEMAQTLRDTLARHLDELQKIPAEELLETRYGKLKAIGRYAEGQVAPKAKA
jgi:acetyl-CoA carboxylase carboxyl transferase subunit alpha